MAALTGGAHDINAAAVIRTALEIFTKGFRMGLGGKHLMCQMTALLNIDSFYY